MISIITPCRAKDAQGAQWLHEAIASVHDQDYADWEMIVVDDHSPAELRAVRAAWPRVRWLDAEAQGVSAARNQAAEAARGELLLPLDADDKLAPGALKTWAAEWDKRGAAGILYSDVVMFGQDYAQVYLSPDYDYDTLLMATFMVVGSLHRRADWEAVGGWRIELSHGLEDWEYWIALGEMGVCGKRIAEPLYWYRRHPTGRLAWLKSNQERWDKAYQAMRDLHRETYNGRRPMGCCGGKARGGKKPLHGGVERVAQSKPQELTAEGLVKVVYTGPRMGDWQVMAGVTRTRYRVPGPGKLVEVAGVGRQGVRPEDVAWFLSVSRGRDFRVVAEPKPAPVLNAAPVVKAPARANSEAWVPVVMEGQRAETVETDAPVREEAVVAQAEAEPDGGKPKRRGRKTA